MVTIGTWNLENLFTTGPAAPPPDVFDAKVRGIAATLREQQVDIAAVQEVGDDAALAALLDELGDEWEAAASNAPDDRGIRVAYVSRLPILEAEDVVGLAPGLEPVQTDDDGGTTDRVGRGFLHVAVSSAAGARVDLVTCHLKSKLISFPDGRFTPRDEDERARFSAYALYRRTAEAATLRVYASSVIAGEGASRSVVVLGDFNDEPQAATTQITQGPPGSEIGSAGEDVPDRGDAWRLLNIAPLIPIERRYSRIYRGRPELIDQLFVTRFVRPAILFATTVGTEALPSVTDDPRVRADEPVSDHAMVLVSLDL